MQTQEPNDQPFAPAHMGFFSHAPRHQLAPLVVLIGFDGWWLLNIPPKLGFVNEFQICTYGHIVRLAVNTRMMGEGVGVRRGIYDFTNSVIKKKRQGYNTVTSTQVQMMVVVTGGGDLTSTSDRERSHLVIRSVAFPPDPVRKGSQKQKRAKESQIIKNQYSHP